jgi:hypothetical protein
MQTVIETSAQAIDTINSIASKIKNSPTGVSFFGIKGYTNKAGETSNYTINVGLSYEKAKASDIALLEALNVTTIVSKSNSVDLELARVALIEAFKKPADENKKSTAQTDAYETIAPNVKRHLLNNTLYVFGTKVHKKVLIPAPAGSYKTVNSAALTIAKNELKKLLKTSKLRMYILDAYTMHFEVLENENVDADVYGAISLEVED